MYARNSNSIPLITLDNGKKEVRIQALEVESKLHQEDIENLTAKVEDLKLQLDDTNTEVIDHSNEIEEIQG